MSTRAAGWVSAQGNYAGSVSRLLAFIIDVLVSGGLFSLGLAVTSQAVQVVTGHSVSWTRTNIVVAIILGAWEFFYFAYSWAASGRTFGMAVLGVRVVRADGAGLDPWHGVLRAVVFPLSFLFFGLGFLGILVQREHRALHDLLAATAVVYAWDARAARLRFLAREAEQDQLVAHSARPGAKTATAMAVPAMAVPAMAVPAMAVPAMALPAMALPAMALPARHHPAQARPLLDLPIPRFPSERRSTKASWRLDHPARMVPQSAALPAHRPVGVLTPSVAGEAAQLSSRDRCR